MKKQKNQDFVSLLWYGIDYYNACFEIFRLLFKKKSKTNNLWKWESTAK